MLHHRSRGQGDLLAGNPNAWQRKLKPSLLDLVIQDESDPDARGSLAQANWIALNCCLHHQQ